MMELQGEDGSIVELPETKELGRGPGIAPHDRSVSRRQVRLRIADGDLIGIEVLGPNPICVVHAKPAIEVEIVKPGSQCSLRIGDKFSLSIHAPVFYTLAAATNGKLVEDDQGVAVDEEEGIAEAVARWQRRKQERLQSDQSFKSSTQEGEALLPDHGDRIGEQVGVGRTQAQDDSQQEANELEQTERPTTNEDDTDGAQKFGFIVEGSEFARYGKKGLDTSKWDWRIGRQPVDDDDEDEEGGGLQQKQNDRTAAGLRTKQKAKLRNEDDDDDDWRGDSEGEKELLSARKRPAPRKKDVQTRSHNLATTSDTIVDPGKKRQMVSTSAHGSDMGNPSTGQGMTKLSRPATASTSTKKISKRQSRASSDEEEDDEGEDLVGFVVDDIEDEDDEVADEEDEWTDEDEGEAVEEDGEINEDPVDAARPAMDKGDIDDKPLCKYGNKCFRKNKDHFAQFRH